jgi:hypothetical protein
MNAGLPWEILILANTIKTSLALPNTSLNKQTIQKPEKYPTAPNPTLP